MSPHSIALSRRELRKHPQSQIRELASGIGRIGFTVPLIVDERLSLVCGHARLAAAKLLELDEVPVIRLDHLTPEQLRLFAMFDNRVAEHGEWDEGALALEFAELALEDVTLDISDSGFAVTEQARLSEKRYYLDYVWRRRVEFPELLHSIKQLAETVRPDKILIED